MLDRIKELHQKMKKLILKSGIKEKAYDSLLVGIELEQNHTLEKLLSKLELVHADWEKAQDIWKCAPEHMWENYETFGIKDLREQELLKEQLINLRKTCYENLKAKRTKSNKNKKSSKSSSVQPENTGSNEADSGRGEP